MLENLQAEREITVHTVHYRLQIDIPDNSTKYPEETDYVLISYKLPTHSNTSSIG